MTIKKLVKLAAAARPGESISITDYLQCSGYHTVTIYVHSVAEGRGIVATLEAKRLTEAAEKIRRSEWVNEPKAEPVVR